jgi:hypothetical protein
MRIALVLFFLAAVPVEAGEVLYESRFVYEPTEETPNHVHASCIVECPNGDLLTVWYENGDPLPEPYFSAQGDKSDDVRIGGARMIKGATAWNAPFVMVDTFGISDNNPSMAIDAKGQLWLVHATLLGVPENTWTSALVHYRISSDYLRPGPPVWSKERILVPHPTGFEAALKNALPEHLQEKEGLEESLKNRLKNPFKVRLGWMPRAHPLLRSDGAMILPLSNENYGIVSMAITKDDGETWTISDAVPFAGLEQPTVTEASDGKLVAFFRSADDEVRIRRSESSDGGMTWSVPALTELVHPFSGLEILYLKSGHLALIYNDQEDSPRDRLAVSISDDDGKTWAWTRHLEDIPGGRFDYPSMIQAKDGSLHASYSYNLKTIKHVRFDAAWVQQGD